MDGKGYRGMCGSWQKIWRDRSNAKELEASRAGRDFGNAADRGDDSGEH